MEEEEAEQVMSEVHLGCPPGFSGPYISHFTFSIPPKDVFDGRYNEIPEEEASSSQMLSMDNDGDLILTRRNHNSCETLREGKDDDCALTRSNTNCQKCLNYRLTIQHNITSSLPSVGLQVWRAALILADFVLHKSFTSSEFNGVTAIELGAGTGLVGIILARVARKIILTDIGDVVLYNCGNNVLFNSGLLTFHETAVNVRELDWKESWPPSVRASDIRSRQRDRYSWAYSDIEEAERATLLLAADVIYSDQLTDSFFSILERLMSRGSEKVLYMALEKRYNFTLDDLDIIANGYAHFRSFLKDDEECNMLDNPLLPCFVGEQIDLADIPQYIKEYERGKDLEIWKITYCRKQFSNSNGKL